MTAVAPGAAARPDGEVHVAAGASRGTVVVLPGRGEHPGVYGRFGRRLAADGYTVVVPARADDASVAAAFTDHPDGTRVLVGSDAGARRAWSWAARHPGGLDALVLAGLPLAVERAAGPDAGGDHEAELDLRTSCPVHRGLLAGDPAFTWGTLTEALPQAPAALPGVPTLLVHGTADRIAPLDAVVDLARGADGATLATVEGGVHDVLNDRFHRSVAARLVLFFEEVGKGAVVRDDGPPPAAPAAPARGRSRRSGPLHVSARLDYALRAVAALPSDPDAEPVRCETVARSRSIPLNSLVNLMVDLRRAHLVRSRRGCDGGYWLARPAAEITVADVVRAVEGEIAAVPDGAIWSDLGRTVTDFLSHRTIEEAAS